MNDCESKFQKLEKQLESRREKDEKKEGKKEKKKDRRVSKKVVSLVVQPSKIVSLQTKNFKFYFCCFVRTWQRICQLTLGKRRLHRAWSNRIAAYFIGVGLQWGAISTRCHFWFKVEFWRDRDRESRR